MALKIAVSPSGYDDIGAVLKQMEYEFTNIKDTQLQDSKLLADYDVIFINCSEACEKQPDKAAKALKQYVEQGGSLYSSDFAIAYIDAAFPGYIQFGKDGQKGNLTAQVVDEGLKANIGKTLPLTFDLGSWRTIKKVKKEVEIYLKANKQPLLVTFEYGQGQVIYTCFHNKVQTSEAEQKLLKFLVLKPLLGKAKSAISAFVATKAAGTVENVGSLMPGDSSPKYQYIPSTDRTNLKVVLNWEGTTAKLSLTVFKPEGDIFAQTEGTTPPLQISIPIASKGKWQYQVKGIEIPHKNFPFVILIGPAMQVMAQDPTFWATVTGTSSSVDEDILEQITIVSDDSTNDNFEDLDITFLD